MEKLDVIGNIPQARFGHTITFITKGKAILFGGATGDTGRFSITGETYSFDVSTKVWKKVDSKLTFYFLPLFIIKHLQIHVNWEGISYSLFILFDIIVKYDIIKVFTIKTLELSLQNKYNLLYTSHNIRIHRRLLKSKRASENLIFGVINYLHFNRLFNVENRVND